MTLLTRCCIVTNCRWLGITWKQWSCWPSRLRQQFRSERRHCTYIRFGVGFCLFSGFTILTLSVMEYWYNLTVSVTQSRWHRQRCRSVAVFGSCTIMQFLFRRRSTETGNGELWQDEGRVVFVVPGFGVLTFCWR